MRVKRAIAVTLSFMIMTAAVIGNDLPAFANEADTTAEIVSPLDGKEELTEDGAVETASQNKVSEDTVSTNKAGFKVDFYVNGSIAATNYTVSDGSVSAPEVSDITTDSYHYEFRFWVLDPSDTTGDSKADLSDVQSDISVYAFFRETALGEDSGSAPVKKPIKKVTAEKEEDTASDEEGGTTVITSVPVTAVITTQPETAAVLAAAPALAAVETAVVKTGKKADTVETAAETKTEEPATQTVKEEEVPLTEMLPTGEEDNKEELTQVEDEEVPLAEAPEKQADNSFLYLIVILLFAAAMVVRTITMQKKIKELKGSDQNE